MGIFKYEIINPTTDNKRPFFMEKNGLFYVPVKKNYNYYVECAITNQDTCEREYFLMLGTEKFDANCRKCNTDNYGRVQIKIRGEIKDYILREMKDRGNVDVEYLESEDAYDVYTIT